MSKLLFVLAVLMILVFPGFALAAELKTGETRASVAKDQVVEDDLYIASGEVDVAGTVNGDVVAAGGTVRISGKVAGDLAVAGGTVFIEGEVADDVRVAGGTVSVSGRIGNDLILFGGTTEVTSEANVAGDVLAGAGSLTISGTTGSVKAGIGELTIASTAKINGDLTYTSDREATIESGATITGQTVREQPTRTGVDRVMQFGGAFPILTLVMALLFLYVFPNKAAKVAVTWRRGFAGNLLWGFLFLIGVPIAAVILMVSLIGLPIGFGLFLIYPILLYVGSLTAALGLGTWLKNLMDREKEPRPTWLAVVLGVAGLAILGYIPFVGWILGFLAFLSGLGALVRYDWDVVTELRAGKTL